MKHIRKKFLIQEEAKEQLDPVKFEIYEKLEGFDQAILKKRKDDVAYLITEKGLKIGGFVHKLEGKYYVFPMPDLTLIYFHNAQKSLKEIKEARKTLLKCLDVSQTVHEPALHEFYEFYGTTSGFIIYLFTSIESFINQLIPDDFVYKRKTNRNIELYNKKQIQEFLDFKTKITTVLFEATGNNFFHKPTSANQLIWNLKEFRDEIIHTKQGDHPVKYEKIIKTSLSFKYADALSAVASLMNFYLPNYIIEGDCGVDF